MRLHSVLHGKILSSSVAALLVLTLREASAAPRNWAGGASSSWGTASNWAGGFIPNFLDEAIFSAISTRNIVDLGNTNRSVDRLTFVGNRGYTLQTGTISLETSLSSSGEVSHLITAPIILGQPNTWEINGAQPFGVTGAITDGTKLSGLSKTGPGTLILSGTGSNLHSLKINGGLTTLSGGTMTLRAPLSEGIPLFLQSGTLRLELGVKVTTPPGGISALGVDTAGARPQFVIANTGSEFSGESAFVGVNPSDRGDVIVEDSGRMQIPGLLVLAQRDTTEASLTVRTNGTVAAGRVALGGLSLDPGLNNARADIVVESGAVLNATNFQVLSNRATVTVNGGTLQVNEWGDQGTFRTQVNLLANPAQGMALRVNGNVSQTIRSLISGNGGIEKLGTGVLTLDNMNNSFNALRITEGTVRVTNDSLGGRGAALLLNGGVLSVAGDLNSTRPLILESNSALEVFSTRSFLSTGGIQGTGNLQKTGAGVLSLRGDVTLAGTLELVGGSVQLQSPGMFTEATSLQVGAGTLLSLNGNSQLIQGVTGVGEVSLGASTETRLTLRAPLQTSSTFVGSFTGAGTVVKEGLGTVTVSGSSTNSGGFLIRQGTLQYVGGNLPGTQLQFDGGRFLGSANYISSHALNVITTGTIETGAGVVNRWTGLSGPGILDVTGPGTLEFGGASPNFTGTLRISGGNVTPQVPSAFPSARFILVSSGRLNVDSFPQSVAVLEGDGTGSVVLTSTELTVAQDLPSTFAGTISGTGEIVKSGTGRLLLTGQSSYNGATRLLDGTLALSGLQNRIPATSNFVFGSGNGSVLELNNTQQTLASISGGVANQTFIRLTGSTLIANQATDTAFAGSIEGTGSFVKTGAGTLTLPGSNGFTGSLQVSGGKLELPNGSGGIGGTLQVSANAELAAAGAVLRETVPQGTGTIRATGNLLIGASGSITGYRHGGTLDVGANRVVLLDADAAQLGSSTRLSSGGRLSSLNGIELPSGTSLTASGTATVEGPLANRGLAAGPVGTSDWLNFDGAVSGNGSFTGNIAMNEAFAPGDGPARLMIGGNLRLSADHSLSLELGGTELGSGYDHLDIAGTLTAAGTLRLTLTGGFTPAAGHAFDLLDAGITAGAFSQLLLPELGTGMSWDTSGLYTTGTLVVVPEPSISILALVGLAIFAFSVRTRNPGPLGSRR